ncbi:MBL fold metallo-hydrolase [Ferrimonas sediminicola]|uniref:MBL fold metallo-hydrolase n=1 Tax=Ferrimonas sediminicola TaxID=2569538 RepID=A0A4U1BDY9_9GAMM|nr:MBL fold metallo-hydrolase [Ferrimonas sediminicola]TKB49008.1 MBL fold metallo-hydrolase [Ferrimonas sediminicola]
MRKLLLMTLLLSMPLNAEDRFKDVRIQSQEVAQGVHMLTGSGGNIGVSAGADGILIIDDQFAPLAGRIQQALAAIKPGPVNYVLNTHYHGDHTGGNAEFAPPATVFAHHNVRLRLAGDDRVNPAQLPLVTFGEGLIFHLNGDTIRVIHLADGHTDGDSLVRFEQANVVHMGDLFFNGMFPFVDLKGGGSVTGYLEAVSEALKWVDADTRVIPGHGELAGRQELLRFQQMLEASILWARKQDREGSLASWQSAFPTELASWSWRFVTTERWVETLYQERDRLDD